MQEQAHELEGVIPHARSRGSDSVWMRGVRRTSYPPLRGNQVCDVAIAGGGITGLTTALLLASEGRRVMVLEARRLGDGTSGATSAHVTDVPDIGYRTLLHRFGEAQARLVVARSHAARLLIGDLVQAEALDCDYAAVPAFRYTEREDEVARLEDEAAAADRLGVRCRLTRSVPLPWPVTAALQFPDQAVFQPVRYLAGLARTAVRRGAVIAERSPVAEFTERGGGVEIATDQAHVRADALVLATHTPLGINTVQTALEPSISYLIAVGVGRALRPALFFDTSDPYFYLRPLDTEGTPVVVLGGADHKTGHEADPESRFRILEAYAQARFGTCEVRQRWSAQLFDPADGLPFIGRSPFASHTYIATGFAGVGLVEGTMAAIELAALLRGETRDNPFAPARLTVRALPRLLSENLDVAWQWLRGRLGPTESLDAVPVGEGRIVRIDGERRAVYRAPDGVVTVLSPVCQHMGCTVRWNDDRHSWDCPCHGARYAPTGELLEGPALRGLRRVTRDDT